MFLIKSINAGPIWQTWIVQLHTHKCKEINYLKGHLEKTLRRNMW